MLVGCVLFIFVDSFVCKGLGGGLFWGEVVIVGVIV